MNPTNPNLSPATPTPPTPPTRSYRSLSHRAQNIARVVGLLVAILLLGSGLGYYIAHVSKSQTKQTSTTPEVKSLTPEEISQLSALGSNLGTSNQLLTIGATAQFNNNVIISKDLSLNGKFNANGPVTLKSLTISGSDTAISGLNVNGNLGVTGASILQKGATIGQLLSVTGNLAVAGTANFSTASATNFSVKNLSISGPILIGHLSTQGPQPTSSSGNSIGGGGTSSISGNDTAGTVNINIGSGSGSGTLMNVSFRAGYPSNVHVLLTPLSAAAASSQVYVTRTANGFQINSASPILPGSLLSFDYFVIQ